MQHRIRLSLLNPYEVDENWFLYQTRLLPEVDQFLTGEPPKSFEHHMEFLDNNFPKKRLIYLIKDTFIKQLFYGYCQAYNLDMENKTIEVGWVIHPQHQGNGIGKRSVELLVNECGQQFPSDYSILLKVKSNNFKARHIYEKCGFVVTKQIENEIQMERANG